MADKYDKLERMRADIQRDKDKVAKLLEQIKHKEARLKVAENSQIVADVGALKLSPEQLGEFLALIESGKISAFMNGGTESPVEPEKKYGAEDNEDEDPENEDFDNESEEDDDEEN